jgi:microcystin-dependent protein
MPVYKWSETAANNATADPTCPFPEGQAPSSLNDGIRGLMAAVAQYTADISGSISTSSSGTDIAYVLSSNSGYTELEQLNGQIIAFSPNVTNAGGPVTLEVDGLGVFPIQPSPGVTLQAGVLIQGTPYVVIFNQSAGAFYLMGSYGNPFNIPLAGGMPYFAPTPPNSAFAFPFGQEFSRTGATAPLFALIGTTYGTGDGETTANLPDLRGRGLFFLDNMGGTAAGRMTAANGFDGTILGNAGGSQTETITLAQLPTGITSEGPATGSITGTAATAATDFNLAGSSSGVNLLGTGPAESLPVTGTFEGAANVTSNNTGGQALPIIPPALMCNLIMRIV